MKKIELPYFGIVVELGDPDPNRVGFYLGGVITSDLKEPCTHCGHTECRYDCDGSQGADEEHEDDDNRHNYNTAIDALESMILACACAGIAIDSLRFREAVETTVAALAKYHE